MALFGSKKLKILSVDDSKLIQLSIKNILEPAGYKVILAYSGEDAIKLAKSNNPDLILLDITMPGMDGVQTCITLKTDPKTASIPIIMVTSASLGAEVDKAFAAGAQGYIIKPINAERLESKIAEILKK